MTPTTLCSCGHPAAAYKHTREGQKACAQPGCDCTDHEAVEQADIETAGDAAKETDDDEHSDK